VSAGTVTRPPSRAVELGAADFWALLRAEWTKFRSVRGWVTGMIVAAVIMDLFGLFLAGQASIACGSPGGVTKHGAACVPPVTLGPGHIPVNDQYYFVRQPLASSGSLTVRVTAFTGLYGGGNAGPGATSALVGMDHGLQPWSKAGIIVAASTRQGAAYAAVMVTGRHGVAMQYDYTNSAAGLPGRVSAASPRWLRLTRSGDTINGYDSADGTHWTQLGTAQLAGLPSTVQIGMFATSPAYTTFTQNFGGGGGSSGPSLATGVFDHVHLVGAAGAWTGDDIGGNFGGGPGSQSQSGGPAETFHQVGGRFTVTGSGDIAPLVNGIGTGAGPSTTFSNHLIGAFAGLIAIVVVAVMFMTAEYRRGLIRVTLAASPRRGRVLAAKAVVVAVAAFVAGLVAALIAVPVGAHLDHLTGQYIYPVSWVTAVRVVVGTAAVMAVAAVFALGLGTIMRRSATAVTTGIVTIVLAYFLGFAPVLPTTAAQWIMRVTPAAGFAVQQSLTQYPQVANQYTMQNGYYPLPWWGGFGVLCLWAVAAMALAVYLLRRRDA
jgi:ABC-type transport system involved in multi-copper enzyme maturation permease subunit